MYAVIETGGKQYRVQPGDIIDVELLEDTGEKGDSIAFDRVLLVGSEDDVKVGTPLVEGAQVSGELVSQVRGTKIRVFKFKRRKQYRRTRGHRQNYHRVRIQEISA
ncbi:MAG: 50S ribosomal protein L21 [Acidobacteriota bacterium]